MKQRLLFLLTLCLLLTGCSRSQNDRSILVFLEEAEGCTVENNGQRILPGEDAVFTLTFDSGVSLTGTDYPGTVHMETKRRITTLTVTNVTQPTRIRLELSRDYAEITYHANGGRPLHSTEDAIALSYSLSLRSRPNTDTGTDMFAREGYTLFAWNSEPDGSGERIGLGSRVTVKNGKARLYAQWAAWSDASDFRYTQGEGGITLTGYTGKDALLVIPAQIDGLAVIAIAAGCFQNCPAQALILPTTLKTVEEGAFQNCAFETLTLFDSIESIRDDSFLGCDSLRTLYINAIEAPFGYTWRKESCYADKVDMLIDAQGEQKLVFYGGCSMWYNLDGYQAQDAFGGEYRIINMALNGTVNSAVQMQIMEAFLESGDVLLHTPELSSPQQMLTQTDMLDTDKSLWCGIENNYDLFTLVDLRTVGGVLGSFCAYLERKDTRCAYTNYYTDEEDRQYLDAFGCIPFHRNTTAEELGDKVYLDPGRLEPEGLARLAGFYAEYRQKGVTVYLSHACVNMDAVPEEQKDALAAVESALRTAAAEMKGVVLLGQLSDFVYATEDFYDTNYHLLTDAAKENTALWIAALQEQMQSDGLLKGGTP